MIEPIVVKEILETEGNLLSGIVIVDKPKWLTSHDVVYWARRKYKTSRVGHAGALDPFATGLLIVLIGKATKLSDSFLEMDKTYEAEILFGVTTDSGDVEGNILRHKSELKLDSDLLISVLAGFLPSYIQFVPVYSSVKVAGDKLRVLARSHDEFRIVSESDKKIIEFYRKGELKKKVELPSKLVNIYALSLMKFSNVAPTSSGPHKIDFKKNELVLNSKFEAQFKALPELPVANILLKCSKGTYVRQLAIDIGEKLNIPSMLINLRRTAVGEYTI